MLRDILLSSAALAALTTASFAADLPNRKAPPVYPIAAPVFTWTGFYVGGQIGGAWTKDDDRFLAGVGFATGKLDASGIVGGLHAGYNLQMGAIVFGLEADIEAAGLNKTSASIFVGGVLAPGIYSYSSKIDWQGSLRPRLGYAFGNALLYVTGGVAFANYKTDYTNPAVVGVGAIAAGAYSFSGVKAGWTLGGGLEYAFNNTWSARAEYRYTDFGSVSDTLAATVPANFFSGIVARHKLTEQAIRVGISYHFSSPASAVVAKY